MSASLDLDARTAAAVRAAGWTVAVAESCTGGLLGGRLTGVPGSSDYFAGGIIAYANSLKSTLLDVPPTLIAAHGAVSEPVALAMAAGVVKATGSAAGLAVTGVAGPAGSEQKPPGTVFVAAVWPGGRECRRLDLPGDRRSVRHQAVKAALLLLLEVAGRCSSYCPPP